MSERIDITIDGKLCGCNRGEYLFDIAKRNGIFIPTLCRHDGLEPRGACRICIVEVVVKGRSKVVTSCIYPVEGPCEVFTNSDSIREQRAVILMLLQARAPKAEAIAQLAAGYDAAVPASFIILDAEKCILCGLCVQACDSLGTGAISTVLRGTEKKVSTPYDKPSADCIGCCSCVQVCPTECIEWMQTGTTRSIWGRTFELVACERCGEIIGTREELAYARKTAEAGAAELPLCGSCRKRLVADNLLAAYGQA